MTFQDLLVHKHADIDAENIRFDYSHAVLHMEIRLWVPPDDFYYNKRLILTFKDCIYFSGDNTSKMAQTGKTEFVEWGEKPSNCCGGHNFCITMEKLLWRNNNEAGRRVNDENKKQYHHYFFANALGDNIDILAKD